MFKAFLFRLYIICLGLVAACGVALTPPPSVDGATPTMGDVTTPPPADVAGVDAAASDVDAAAVDAAADGAADVEPPFEEAPRTCPGCFLGASCVPSTPTACGLNSACIRCPAPRVPECQEATCENGGCGIRNVPDGTGCTGGVCIRGACNRCGSNDTMCCPAPGRCNPGLTCVQNEGRFQYCVPCGTLGTACCGGVGTVMTIGGVPVSRNPGGTCDPGLVCNAQGACSCGALGEQCCPGSVCREGRCRLDGRCGV